jgi:anti-sigma B factor antagonist
MFASTNGSEDRDGVISVVPETDAIVTVCLAGDFDLTNARALDDQLDRVLESKSGVIVDLSQATFIDSSVIHALVRAAKTARAREQAVVVQLGTAAIVERVFELAGIAQLLPRAHDRQEAARIIQQKAEVV